VTELRVPRLTCRDVVELLADYLDDALADSGRRRVDAHLDTCPDCAAYVGQFRHTIRVVGRLRKRA
jgi:anti-sigma factor RsiW